MVVDVEEMAKPEFAVLHCGQVMSFERSRSWRNGPLLLPRTTYDTSWICLMCHARLNTTLVVPDS